MTQPEYPWGLIANPVDPEGRVGVVGLTDHLPPYLITQSDDLAVLMDLKALLDQTWASGSESLRMARESLTTEFARLNAPHIDSKATIDNAIQSFEDKRAKMWSLVLDGLSQSPLPLQKRT